MKKILPFLFLICLGLSAQAQLNRTNVSLQVGYHGKLLNPRPLNAVIDSFNFYSDWEMDLADVSSVTGFFAGVGLHPGRSHFRLDAMNYNAMVSASGMDDMGVEQRRDLSLQGWRFSLGFTSELIRFYDEGHFCVGASFNVNYLNITSTQKPAAEFMEGEVLDPALTSIKPSFTVHTPFRFGIGPQVKISLEPYYQIYFGPTDFGQVNEALNPQTFQNTPISVREGDLDHLGLNAAVIVFLIPR
ncbi:MAG: hypothetical protein AAFP02_12110 [Bacteroidota bacterium]